MISISLNGCNVSILPIVNGLEKDAETLASEYGKYDAYAVALGIEGIEALRKRNELPDESFDVSELDLVYADRMKCFGELQIPSPAFCKLIDLCEQDGKKVIPLDMPDEEFDNAYASTVSAFQFTNQHRLAKKGMKAELDLSSPEAAAISWDAFVQKNNKGLNKINLLREKYIANEIVSISNYHKSLLAVIECERVNGIEKILKNEI